MLVVNTSGTDDGDILTTDDYSEIRFWTNGFGLGVGVQHVKQ